MCQEERAHERVSASELASECDIDLDDVDVGSIIRSIARSPMLASQVETSLIPSIDAAETTMYQLLER